MELSIPDGFPCVKVSPINAHLFIRSRSWSFHTLSSVGCDTNPAVINNAVDRQTEKPADEPSPAPIGSSDLISISTDERSLKIRKKKICQVVKHKIFNYTTVEFRWLELKRTVKMWSIYQKLKPPKCSNFRQNKILEMWFRQKTVS